MHSVTISEQGVQLTAEGDCLVAWRGTNRLRSMRVREIEQLLLCGHIDITHGALMLLLRRGVDVVWLSQSGQFRARLVGPAHKNSTLRLAQYQCVTDAAFSLSVAQRIIAGKIHQQRQILLRAQRRWKSEELVYSLAELRQLKERAYQVHTLDSLRGLEGRAAAIYFQWFGLLVTHPELAFRGRTRRPPKDEINALLSFGYAVLGSIIQSDIAAAGLDPMLGFFHQPHYGRPALMLDILELYRPWIDQLTLRLVNRRQVGPADFDRLTTQTVEEILSEDTGDDLITIMEEPDPGANPDLQPEDTDRLSRSTAQASGAQEANQPIFPHAETTMSAAAGDNTSTATITNGIGVFLNDTGRKIFFAEFYRKLREDRWYPRRQATFSTRDIIREEIYHLARAIESRENYDPFILDER